MGEEGKKALDSVSGGLMRDKNEGGAGLYLLGELLKGAEEELMVRIPGAPSDDMEAFSRKENFRKGEGRTTLSGFPDAVVAGIGDDWERDFRQQLPELLCIVRCQRDDGMELAEYAAQYRPGPWQPPEPISGKGSSNEQCRYPLLSETPEIVGPEFIADEDSYVRPHKSDKPAGVCRGIRRKKDNGICQWCPLMGGETRGGEERHNDEELGKRFPELGNDGANMFKFTGGSNVNPQAGNPQRRGKELRKLVEMLPPLLAELKLPTEGGHCCSNGRGNFQSDTGKPQKKRHRTVCDHRVLGSDFKITVNCPSSGSQRWCRTRW